MVSYRSPWKTEEGDKAYFLLKAMAGAPSEKNDLDYSSAFKHGFLRQSTHVHISQFALTPSAGNLAEKIDSKTVNMG